MSDENICIIIICYAGSYLELKIDPMKVQSD